MCTVEVMTKICHKCKQVLPLTEFYKVSKYRDQVSSTCKECDNARRRKHYQANKEQHKKTTQKYYQEHKEEIIKQNEEYRIKRGPDWWRTVGRKHYHKYKKEYSAKRKAKRLASHVFGVCPICKQYGRLCYDHDHATGLFRSWICGACNIMIGHSYESGRTLFNAIEYLQKH